MKNAIKSGKSLYLQTNLFPVCIHLFNEPHLFRILMTTLNYQRNRCKEDMLYFVQSIIALSILYVLLYAVYTCWIGLCNYQNVFAFYIRGGRYSCVYSFSTTQSESFLIFVFFFFPLYHHYLFSSHKRKTR